MKRAVVFGTVVSLFAGGFFLLSKECHAVTTSCPQVEQASLISNQYYWHTQQNFEAAAAAGDKIVLFFYAPWCGTCSELDSQLSAQRDKVPENITILKVEYDKDKILRRKYAVTAQHTLVQVDAAGNEVNKWVGGDIDQLVGSVR